MRAIMTLHARACRTGRMTRFNCWRHWRAAPSRHIAYAFIRASYNCSCICGQDRAIGARLPQLGLPTPFCMINAVGIAAGGAPSARWRPIPHSPHATHYHTRSWHAGTRCTAARAGAGGLDMPDWDFSFTFSGATGATALPHPPRTSCYHLPHYHTITLPLLCFPLTLWPAFLSSTAGRGREGPRRGCYRAGTMPPSRPWTSQLCLSRPTSPHGGQATRRADALG